MIKNNFIFVILAYQCGQNEHYELAVGCEATCYDKSPSADECFSDEEEGCVCDDGFYRDNNRCVPESECGCSTDDDEYFPVS